MKRDSKNRERLDLVQIQAKLDQSPEKRVWRGLEELAGTPEYRDFLASRVSARPARRQRASAAAAR